MNLAVLKNRETLKAALAECGSKKALSRRIGCATRTVRYWCEKLGVEGPHDAGRTTNQKEAEALLPYLKQPVTVLQLSEAVDRSPKTVQSWLETLTANGYNIVQVGDTWTLSKVPDTRPAEVSHHTRERELSIAFVSDTHLGSKCSQLTYLNEFYDVCESKGIQHVYHSGDLITGDGVYRGQIYDNVCNGFDAQVEYAAKHYPQRKGITTHVIGGNHDLIYVKQGGADPLRALHHVRPDIDYLGPYSAWVEITDGCILYLLHPDGGPAYALSYRLQKLVESFSGGRKPHLCSIGHWHSLVYIFQRNVHAWMPGCFEYQTDYERRKMLQPQVGGLIVHLKFAEDGTITKFVPEFYPYLKHLDGDWREYAS